MNLTTHVKKQFARKKITLAAFFDVRKAYDNVLHARRLLFKLKSIGLSGNMYSYLKAFLSNRSIQAIYGMRLSSTKSVNMGIPQGSIIAPSLFIMLLYDVPKYRSENINLVEYAYDVAIWVPRVNGSFQKIPHRGM